jgi:hypothetical protein
VTFTGAHALVKNLDCPLFGDLHVPFVIRHDCDNGSHFTSIGTAGSDHLHFVFQTCFFDKVSQKLENMLSPFLFAFAAATGIKDTIGLMIKESGHCYGVSKNSACGKLGNKNFRKVSDCGENPHCRLRDPKKWRLFTDHMDASWSPAAVA